MRLRSRVTLPRPRLWASLASALLASACGSCDRATAPRDELSAAAPAKAEPPPTSSKRFAKERRGLVESLRATDVKDRAVLEAIGRVCRHCMVPEHLQAKAYEDRPLPIGHDQTISQPYVVALMTQLADVDAGDKVLEVGTGSGYQAAVLAELGAEVYSIEIVEPLAKRARRTLDELGYGERVHTRVGDGYGGWPEQAPFDAVIITAAPPEVPEPLVEQLAVGGKLVAPVGRGYQQLVVITQTEQGPVREQSIPVRFVPMTGKAQRAP